MWLFWFDAMLCFRLPRLARWIIGVRVEGDEFLPIDSVRFRWERSAHYWIEGYGADIAVRRKVGMEYRIMPLDHQ